MSDEAKYFAQANLVNSSVRSDIRAFDGTTKQQLLDRANQCERDGMSAAAKDLRDQASKLK